MRVLIVANGEVPSEHMMASLAAEAEMIFVVDGAVNFISEQYQPDVVCGDFDSIDQSLARDRFPNTEFIQLDNQELNDLEKTIMLARERGATNINILGAFGKRIDQELVSISLNLKLHSELAITMYSQDEKLLMLSPKCARKGMLTTILNNNQIVSLIPFSTDAHVSLTGVKWPLDNQALALGSAGVSNCALGGEIKLVVHQGIVAVTLPWP
jgi:thiamine pyrophosphokinase